MNDNGKFAGSSTEQAAIQCNICRKELDYLTASVSLEEHDSIYICFGSIKQKIFVYGRYIHGNYGAISINQYFSKEECSDKKCEIHIKNELTSRNEEEYSRLTSCKKGEMKAIILSESMIETRKNDLGARKLENYFPESGGNKKYYCFEDAKKLNFTCSCGDKLVQVGSGEYGELTGMDDQEFMQKYLPGILEPGK
ncbi:MAG: hypothetical protein GY754_15565 [bacterium]|nr:hypothetical protein [bacterium]